MEKTLSDYIALSKNIDDLKSDKKLKVAILSSFTLSGLDETLHVKCSELGIRYQSYVAGYNQYNQELLDIGRFLGVLFLFVGFFFNEVASSFKPVGFLDFKFVPK